MILVMNTDNIPDSIALILGLRTEADINMRISLALIKINKGLTLIKSAYNTVKTITGS